MDADLIIAGGGLAGGLIALAVKTRHPDARVTIVEQDAVLGGNHIWSFFDTDIAAADRWLVDPLIAHHWDGYDIAFPERRRTLRTGYSSIVSEDFDTTVRAVLGAGGLRRDTAVAVDRTRIVLADQSALTATAVIDARGTRDWGTLDCGWQKFVGRIYDLAAPHGLTRPIIIDATVAQHDGYRFVYILPFGVDQLFVEDTYYSDDPALDVATLERRLDAYVAAQGWQVRGIARQETGVLPVVKRGEHAAFLDAQRDTPTSILAGSRAGVFQPVTSYSLPDAVRVAVAVADAWPCDGDQLARIVADVTDQRWRSGGFGRILNRMLFDAAEPDQRFQVLQHFYRLPEPLIERFYAGQLRAADRFRVLSGRPPVPIGRALRSLIGKQ
jgi:lycopene beta-cyclase